ncbi:MAG: FtsQ-type POTRA domain-containing protein [Treponema sp.]|nr:FtsQ-type POTRA domain-containing protein [Treponema sp.]
MLGDFIYTEEDEEVSDGRSVDRGHGSESADKYDAPPRIERALKRFLVLAVVFICGGLIWWFFISPTMAPATVHVFTFPGLDRAAVLHHAGIGGRSTFASVNAAEAQLLLSGHPLVESARVVKSFPDRISIYLEPRQAVAVSIARINGRMQPVYFDRHGVAFMIGGEPYNAPAWMPVVSGLYHGLLALYLGARLPEPVLPLFSRIGAIMDENPNIWQAISEIGVAWNDNGSFDLVLYPVNNFIRVRMGSDISVTDIYYALLMLDVLNRSGGDIPDEIDVRSGIGVLTTQGARLGG